MQFRRKVQHGQKMGKKLGFPTINLNVGTFADHYEPGVYACKVKIKETWYKGGLHFGPKKGSLKSALEIHILNFEQTIYGKWISFSVELKIRASKPFKDWNELKKQIQQDIERIKKWDTF